MPRFTLDSPVLLRVFTPVLWTILAFAGTAQAASPAGPDDAETENESPITFKMNITSAHWCLGKASLVATVVSPAGAALAVAPSQYAVYFGNQLLPKNLFRVTRNHLSVCVPSLIFSENVSFFGPDNTGRGVQFSSDGYPRPGSLLD
jgi:hypothetical protein